MNVIGPIGPELGRGRRVRIPNSTLRDYVVGSTVVGPSHLTPVVVSPSPSGTPYPLTDYMDCSKFSTPYKVFLAALTTPSEPRSYKEAPAHSG